jgi:hypothetical protein
MAPSGLSECGVARTPTPSSGVLIYPEGLSYGDLLVDVVPELLSWLTV